MPCAAVLRFSGALQILGGQVVIAAEQDTGSVAVRLRRETSEVYGYPSQVSVLAGGGPRRRDRYLLRMSGSVDDVAAAWRGAFLARGPLPEPGRSSPALEVACPSPEAAVALVGAARRLGVVALTREAREGHRVVVRDDEAITGLLTRMGADGSVTGWQERRTRRDVPAVANRLANFDDANSRRASLAPATTTAGADQSARDPR